MKNLVWVAGVILILSFVFPNGITFPVMPEPTPAPVVPGVPADPALAQILMPAQKEDKARVVGVYSGLKTVLLRDNASRVSTTEKFAELQARTLELAIDTPGKYPGLDVAIEAVFQQAVRGPQNDVDATVVQAVTPEMQSRLVRACDTIIASAQ
jgi:hypothetical protein